ncbi:sensor histidine kinase [Sphingomonas sp. RS6]
MLALSALATLAALALAGLIVAGILGRVVTQGIDRRLDAQLALIATAVGKDGTLDRARLDQVQGALDAGPGWRWRIVAPGQQIGSEDFPQIEAEPHARLPHDAGRASARPIEGHDREGGGVHGRLVRLDTSGGGVTIAATAPRDVIDRPARDALLPLLGMLAAIGALLGLAAVSQVRLGLRPVRRLRDAVAEIRSGGTGAIDEAQPEELRPLAEELNALVRDNEAALATARASAANLAHALKTPVATLALELRGDPRAAQVERIDATIRHHLSRARLESSAIRAATAVEPALNALVQTISQLHADRGIVIEAEGASGHAVAIDAPDFDELVGNLIDNAVRHARVRVAIAVWREGRTIGINVADDGPGIPPEARERATAPGVRLDERGDGHGFGLAIARELAALYGGTLTLDEADQGGLAATVVLPSATLS